MAQVARRRWLLFASCAAVGGSVGVVATWFQNEAFRDWVDAKVELRQRTKGFVYRSWRTYELGSVKQLSSTTKLMRFLFERDDIEAGLRPISCILGRSVDNPETREFTQSPYYPLTRNANRGYFDIIVKKRPNDKVSNYLHSLKPGDIAEFKGTLMTFPYRAGMYEHMGLIAGGAGIAPMYQLIQEILANPLDQTKVSLVYASKSADEAVLKKQLDQLQKKHPTQFRVRYVVEKAPWFWSEYTGKVSTQLLRENMPPAGRSTMILISGPSAMGDMIAGTSVIDRNGWYAMGPITGMLAELGFRKDHVWKL